MTTMIGQDLTRNISSPPSLLGDTESNSTNTHALILPHQSLFLPQILSLLREHYEQYGRIAHWAPVRGFGRVIIVWEEVQGAEEAKKRGDFLKLDVDLPAEENHVPGEDSSKPEGSSGNRGLAEDGSTDTSVLPSPNGEASGSTSNPRKGHRRRNSKGPRKGIILRLHTLPYTAVNPDSTTTYLQPPHVEKNFLISPPGSPPEGWEPIVEEGPNTTTLADDLQRALESLQLNGRHRRRGSKEIILEEGGVRVEVEDTTMVNDDEPDSREQRDWSGVEEVPYGDRGIWRHPNQLGGTPSGKMKIIPTPMPPR